ncbi:CFEM domain [Geosmithia morbida]|uniref:CFEM domain n=1 Tax=Geosmithia morbida TaxID=1094350 RepID=A0A9P4YTS8_9HYPO|nr:CFEM domain [Geosmithia morbida]KAF4120884.1 CFEM domain [Geosmithia morbida]
MALGRFSLLALGLSLLGFCQAASAASRLAAYPECAQECLVEAITTTKLCALTDQECMCTNEAFQDNVTSCVTTSCTVIESLTTKNATTTACGAPVRDRSHELVIVSQVMIIVASCFVIARLVHKIIIMKVGLALDDWLIIATKLATAPSVVIIVYGTTANGLGKDIWTLTAQQITNVLRYFYVMAILYFLQTTLVKLSIISFYMRVFPARRTRRLLWGTFVFTSLWGLAFVLVALFQCWPIDAFWTRWEGSTEGRCVNANSMAWSNAAINIALDLWVLAIPMWELRCLQLHWKKKVGVALMFCVGTFVTVTSILRLQSLITFAATSNSTWEFFSVSLWSTVEIAVGVICACLPTVRLLFVKIFPALGGSTYRKTASYRHYGTDGPSGGSAVHGTTAQVVSMDRLESNRSSGGNSGTDGHSGIIFHKTYDVQFTDNDEEGLVNAPRRGVPDAAL